MTVLPAVSITIDRLELLPLISDQQKHFSPKAWNILSSRLSFHVPLFHQSKSSGNINYSFSAHSYFRLLRCIPENFLAFQVPASIATKQMVFHLIFLFLTCATAWHWLWFLGNAYYLRNPFHTLNPLKLETLYTCFRNVITCHSLLFQFLENSIYTKINSNFYHWMLQRLVSWRGIFRLPEVCLCSFRSIRNGIQHILSTCWAPQIEIREILNKYKRAIS